MSLSGITISLFCLLDYLKDPKSGLLIVGMCGVVAFTFWMLMWVAYAAVKGYPEIVGWLAFLGPIGIIVLLCLPSNARVPQAKAQENKAPAN